MKTITVSKHKKSDKDRHDGHRPDGEGKLLNKKTPPRFENHNGEPIE